MEICFYTRRENVAERWAGILPESARRVESIDQVPAGARLLLHGELVEPVSFDRLMKSLTDRSVQVLFLDDVPEDERGIRVLKAGALAYCNTFIHSTLMPEVFAVVDRGDVWAGQSLVQSMLKQFLNGGQPQLVENTVKADLLADIDFSAREKEVLDLVLTGASNKEIARDLGITERTVKAHLTTILRKAGARDRLELILLAKQLKAS